MSGRAFSFTRWTIALAVFSSSCAIDSISQVDDGAIAIEKIDSSRANTGIVQVREESGRLKVWGRIEKRHEGRGRIPGQLIVEVSGDQGEKVARETMPYYVENAKLGVSRFSENLSVRPHSARRVRIIHEPHANKPPRDSGVSEE